MRRHVCSEHDRDVRGRKTESGRGGARVLRSGTLARQYGRRSECTECVGIVRGCTARRRMIEQLFFSVV